MSVILEALHKARREGSAGNSEQPPPRDSRALDPMPTPQFAKPTLNERLGASIRMLVVGSVVVIVLLLVGASVIVAQRLGLFTPSKTTASLSGGVVAAGTSDNVAASASGAPLPNGAIATPGPVSIHNVPGGGAGDLPIAIYRTNELPPPAASATNSEVRVGDANKVSVTLASEVDHAPSDGKPVVGTIMCDAGNCTAIVNGQSAHAGDEIGDYRIESIAPDHVMFKKGDEEPFKVKSRR